MVYYDSQIVISKTCSISFFAHGFVQCIYTFVLSVSIILLFQTLLLGGHPRVILSSLDNGFVDKMELIVSNFSFS